MGPIMLQQGKDDSGCFRNESDFSGLSLEGGALKIKDWDSQTESQ